MLSFLILLVSYLTLLPKNSGTWNIATGIFCSNSLSPPNPTSAPMDILGLILCHRYPNFAVCTHEHVVGSTTSRRRRCGVLQTPPNVWMKKVGRRWGRVWSTECKAETQWLAFLVALKTNLSRRKRIRGAARSANQVTSVLLFVAIICFYRAIPYHYHVVHAILSFFLIVCARGYADIASPHSGLGHTTESTSVDTLPCHAMPLRSKVLNQLRNSPLNTILKKQQDKTLLGMH